eukprot:1150049-Pelagomonas_calceolata.AAC.6
MNRMQVSLVFPREGYPDQATSRFTLERVHWPRVQVLVSCAALVQAPAANSVRTPGQVALRVSG